MVDREDGGESERLAPVIPLFGAASRGTPAAPGDRPQSRPEVGDEHGQSARGDDAAAWRSTWSGGASTARGVAPREDSSRGASDGSPSDRHPARGKVRSAPRLRALQIEDEPAVGDYGPSPDQLRESAEELLVRKLRTRSLSISEARLVLRGFERDGARLESTQIDDVLDEFCRRGYLDDRVLADQLISAGVERKGQGRVALSRALAQRGITRDVIDSALSELPDDDAARALDFARTKASSLARLDHDTALRRLVGQLARRGYNGAIAMSAARTALGENTHGRPATGVRFIESD